MLEFGQIIAEMYKTYYYSITEDNPLVSVEWASGV